MSLEARTVEGKQVVFSFSPGTNNLEMTREGTTQQWLCEGFCNLVRSGWDDYLDGRIEQVMLGNHPFAPMSDAASVTQSVNPRSQYC